MTLKRLAPFAIALAWLVGGNAALYGQTTHSVCVAETWSAGSCSGMTAVFTPASLTINVGDMIEFTTRMELLGGYSGTHDIQFSGSAANNVMLTISSNALAPWTSITTPPFTTPGTFPMECVNGNHCTIADVLMGISCTGYHVTVVSNCSTAADFTISPIMMCVGDSVQLTNSSVNATSYSWIYGGNVFSTQTNPKFAVPDTGTIDITLVAMDGTCTDSLTLSFEGEQVPDLSVNPIPVVCEPMTVDLAGAVVDFNAVSGTISFVYVGPPPTPVPNPSAVTIGGNYTIIKTSQFGCIDTITASVVINPAPDLSVLDPSPPCPPNTVDLTSVIVTDANATIGTYSYYEDMNATMPVANPSAIAVAGTYYIVKTTGDGCSDTVATEISFAPVPDLSVTDPDPACDPNTVDLTAVMVTDAAATTGSFSYYEDAAATIMVATPSAVSVSGDYYVVKTTNLTCSDTAAIHVTINPSPDLTVTDPASVCEPNTVDLTAVVITDANSTTGTIAFFLDAAATQPVPNPSAVGTSGMYYAVKTTTDNCSDTAAIGVTIEVCNAIDYSGSRSIWSLYPNPNNGIFHLTTGQHLPPGTVIKVYNVLGEHVYTHTLSYTTEDFYTIRLPEHLEGLYYLKVSSGFRMWTPAFVISR